jgi:hypothetical protein
MARVDHFDDGLLEPAAGEISDCFRPILVAARRDDAIEVGHQVVVEGDRDALHVHLRRIFTGS